LVPSLYESMPGPLLKFPVALVVAVCAPEHARFIAVTPR